MGCYLGLGLMILATLIEYSIIVNDWGNDEQAMLILSVTGITGMLWIAGLIVFCHWAAEQFVLRSLTMGVFGMIAVLAYKLSGPKPAYWITYLLHASWGFYAGMVSGIFLPAATSGSE